jgi:hypothetical protein
LGITTLLGALLLLAGTGFIVKNVIAVALPQIRL